MIFILTIFIAVVIYSSLILALFLVIVDCLIGKALPARFMIPLSCARQQILIRERTRSSLKFTRKYPVAEHDKEFDYKFNVCPCFGFGSAFASPMLSIHAPAGFCFHLCYYW